MKRIGIIGTESTHAIDFAKLINLKDHETGEPKYNAAIVGVYGPDRKSAEQVAKEAHTDFIAECPEDFFCRVDAMMITSRRGSVHSDYALPFIGKNIPLYIDKPFTSDYVQAKRLTEEAKKRGVPLCGGSGCKGLYDVLLLKNSVEACLSRGEFITAGMNFSADMESVYDGFFFYAPHLTEMALTVFGYNICSVRAFEKKGSVTVLARYPNFDVTLNYTKDSEVSCCVLYTRYDNIFRRIDLSFLLENELASFLKMLETGKMELSYEHLIKPVAVIEAILASLKSGGDEVAVL